MFFLGSSIKKNICHTFAGVQKNKQPYKPQYSKTQVPNQSKHLYYENQAKPFTVLTSSISQVINTK